jgi:glutathione S-transferase
MRLIAKRILKRHGKVDGALWVIECLNHVETELGEADFLSGSQVSIADAALHGAMMCVEDFPIFQDMMARPKLKSWFDRVNVLRNLNRHRAPTQP